METIFNWNVQDKFDGAVFEELGEAGIGVIT